MLSVPVFYLVALFVAKYMQATGGGPVQSITLFHWAVTLSLPLSIGTAWRQTRRRKKRERSVTLHCVSLRFRP